MFIKSDVDIAGFAFDDGKVMGVDVMGFKRGKILFAPGVSTNSRGKGGLSAS